MAEQHPLGEAGGAGGVLQVDGVFGCYRCLAGAKLGIGSVLSPIDDRAPGCHARGRIVGKRYRPAELRNRLRLQFSRRAVAELRADLTEDGEVIRALEAIDEKDGAGVGLAGGRERLEEFDRGGEIAGGSEAFGRVDRPSGVRGLDGPRCRPLGSVGSPHGDVITVLDAHADEAFGGLVDQRVVGGEGGAEIELRENDGFVIGQLSSPAAQSFPDRQSLYPGVGRDHALTAAEG